jgi:hypothetical protein
MYKEITIKTVGTSSLYLLHFAGSIFADVHSHIIDQCLTVSKKIVFYRLNQNNHITRLLEIK